PQVHDDIDDRTPAASHQFRLRRRRKLKVHAANRAFLLVEADIRLGDRGFETMCLELVLTEGPGRESAIVVPAFKGNDERALERGLGKDHRQQLLRAVVRCLADAGMKVIGLDVSNNRSMVWRRKGTVKSPLKATKVVVWGAPVLGN